MNFTRNHKHQRSNCGIHYCCDFGFAFLQMSRAIIQGVTRSVAQFYKTQASLSQRFCAVESMTQ